MVGTGVGLFGTGVELVGTGVESASLFGHQHVDTDKVRSQCKWVHVLVKYRLKYSQSTVSEFAIPKILTSNSFPNCPIQAGKLAYHLSGPEQKWHVLDIFARICMA